MVFRFRLQAVLEHRRHLEDLALNEYAQKLTAQRQCQQQIDWLKQEHARARAELQVKERQGMPAKDFILANEYVTVLRLMAMREQSRLPLLEAEVAEARDKLRQATIDRKVMESLRERHLARWEREQLLNEQRLLDEAAVGAFVRRDEA